MSMEVRYEAGVSATYEDITDRVRTFTLDVTQNAEEGSVAMSTIVIDDPEGDYEIKGYRRIAVYETEGPEDIAQLTYNGFIVDRRVIRGPNRTGAGRQWVCSVVDTNCLLEFRIMTGSDANRPAETDIDRMDWLLGESEMDRIPNHTYYNTSGPVAMDAADYRGQRAVDIINDCAQQSGKNYFAICVDATAAPIPAAPGATTFWYDWADSTEYSSTLSLSNDLADIQADPDHVYEISLDSELTRDPARVYSGAYVRYDGGDEYEEDSGISAEFTRRDSVVPADNVKTSAKATARALRYLADMATEEDRITTSVYLPAAKVNLIREGMRIPFKATHFPDEYHEFTWQRILRRTVKQVTPEVYLLTLTLGTGPSWPPGDVEEIGEGSAYMALDNGFYVPFGSNIYINGTPVVIGSGGDPNQIDFRFEIPDGVLMSGDNVVAIGIENGTSPGSWAGGNATGVVFRAYVGVDDSGPIIAYTSGATKIWPVSNLPSGTLGGEPSGWEQQVFDDSAWDDAVDVGAIPYAGPLGLDDTWPPTSPAMWVGPAAAGSPYDLSNTYPQGLIWLARIHFTL